MNENLLKYSVLANMRNNYILEGKEFEDWWCENTTYDVRVSEAQSYWDKALKYSVYPQEWNKFVEKIITLEVKNLARRLQYFHMNEGVEEDEIAEILSKNLIDKLVLKGLAMESL